MKMARNGCVPRHGCSLCKVTTPHKEATIDILPSALETCIQSFRPLLRAEVFDTFYYLLAGLLEGCAKFGTVRASVFAPADYQPARISDFFTTHRVSPQALMAELTALSLRLRYGGQLPKRLCWIADSTHPRETARGKD